MVRLGYLIPFAYFWETRLRKGSIGFHALFEWGAAAALVIFLSSGDTWLSLESALFSYIAFICLYEIGYMVNDLFAARSEQGGRLRGPQGASAAWVFLWIIVRIAGFMLVTLALGKLHLAMWWAYFGGLVFTFTLHNWLRDVELKSGTFLWLSWFRFMAPVMFSIPEEYLLGVAFACAMSYSAFRQLGYLDSKGLLVMPGRKRRLFRWFVFVLPLVSIAAVYQVSGAKGYVVLVAYYAFVSSLGSGLLAIWHRLQRMTSGQSG